MTTRSVIAMENETTGAIECIYCHNNGEPDYNGSILLESYNTPEKLRELLALGNLSALGKHVAPVKELALTIYPWITQEAVPHSFRTPHEDVTVAYRRDRGEEMILPKVWQNRRELFEQMASEYSAAYAYLFSGGKWWFTTYKEENWQSLADFLKK